MKYLIVNADDFGASRGINRGILEAHRRGIVTSTSLMVTTQWSEEATALARAAPELDVGLHVDCGNGGRAPESGIELTDAESWKTELHSQLRRFEELVGRLPTHLDSHHNGHRDARLLPFFLDVARRYRLPLREHSPARYLSNFYGQWGGETHLEQISVDSLLHMLETEIGEAVTELGCHPGYVDADLCSGYASEREAELRTLCDPAIPAALAERRIQLISFRDLSALRQNAPD